jgi:aminocarboxymuconate-semialdehyde decarboxylase
MPTDVHCHHVPPSYLRYLDTHRTAFDMRWTWIDDERAELHAGPRCFAMSRDFVDAGRHLAAMDRLGIRMRVLSLATPLIDYAAPVREAADGARLVNDELAALRALHPDRFDAWAYLPLQGPQEAAAELERAVRDLGLRGGHVSTNVGGRYLDDAALDPVLATAERLDVPLFVHPSNPPGQDRTTKYELAVVSGYLFDTTLNVFNMVFGGLLDRHPRLRLCCTHAGGYALLLHGRMQREVDTNPALARRITRPVVEYLRRLHYDTVCLEPAYLAFAIGVAGADRFVLGSDAPFPLGEPDPVGFVRAACADAAIADRILTDNAETLRKGRT